ncbi:VOC family protein [Sedimenticola sp.]|uniref:VOC family protein n=1 Tax=Sedimenticola sp. TaxID=1940285 RepID=UPI003D124715
MILDHIGVVISDYERSKVFYSRCLAPLGITLVMEVEGWAGYGREGKPEFWFGPAGEANQPMHIAFAAENRAQVDRFYQAALEAGGKDNGTPGIREIYHPNYYGAFVYDPDGHNIEAVCHLPE